MQDVLAALLDDVGLTGVLRLELLQSGRDLLLFLRPHAQLPIEELL